MNFDDTSAPYERSGGWRSLWGVGQVRVRAMLAAELVWKRVFRARLARCAQSLLPLCGIVVLGVAALPAAFSQTALAPPSNPTQPQHKKSKEAPPPPPDPTVPVPAVAPNLLDQPALPATVKAGNNELTVMADNSSLAQILQQVSSETGMKLDGLGGDERVFGSFGPGAPREVLTALLNGTSYNVMMVGDLPNGAPRELLLTSRGSGGGSAPANANQNPAQTHNPDEDNPDDSGNTDDSSSDDSAPPMQYTPPSIAPSTPVPSTPPPRTMPQMRNMPSPPQE
jgi:hypothetical protein